MLGIALLVAMAIGARFLPAMLPGPSEEAVIAESSRIGWMDPEAADPIAREIFERVNDERRERGLTPLAWHDGLAELASAWSLEMLETGYRHSPQEFRAHPDFAGTGENIFMGPTDAGEAHVGWMRSDGHRQAILGRDYSAVGIGVVCRNDGRMWATQIFGVSHGTSPSAAVDQPEEPIVRRDPGVTCPISSIGVRPR